MAFTLTKNIFVQVFSLIEIRFSDVLQLTNTKHYTVLELVWTIGSKCTMDCFIYQGKHKQANNLIWPCVGALENSFSPACWEKWGVFSFQHNNVPVQLKAPTGQSGLDRSQTATVTFKVCRQQHSLVYWKHSVMLTLRPLCFVLCPAQTFANYIFYDLSLYVYAIGVWKSQV